MKAGRSPLVTATAAPGCTLAHSSRREASDLPKQAKLRFQMHYKLNGTATTDQTKNGLVFAKEPPKHEVRVTGIFNDKINIPAGANNHLEVAKLPIPSEKLTSGKTATLAE